MSEEVQKDDGSVKVSEKTPNIPNSPYFNVKRELSEEDLASPAILRILLGEVDKLESRTISFETQLNMSQKAFTDMHAKFHEADKDKAILAEKVKSSKAHEILYSFCISAGSIIIGFSRSLIDGTIGNIIIGLGICLIIGGIISKALQWK